jgi:hypothetical protein
MGSRKRREGHWFGFEQIHPDGFLYLRADGEGRTGANMENVRLHDMACFVGGG